jgi:hypothetical protein
MRRTYRVPLRRSETRLLRRLLVAFAFAFACLARAATADLIVHPHDDLASLVTTSPPAAGIRVVQGTTTLRFRIGDEVLALEGVQQRGQEIHSRIEFAPAGTSPDLAVRCPPAVGRGGAQE